MTDDGKEKKATRILIVEGESLLAEDLRLSIESLGYVVRGKVSTGKEAVDLAEKLSPDLILMDIKLQDEMDGIEAAKQIRTQLDIPVIYLTGYSEQGLIDRAKLTEPYGYLAKPFSSQELKNTIETALYRHTIDKKNRESEEKFRFLAENMADVVWTADATPRLTYASPSIKSLLGYTPEEFTSMSFAEFLTPESYDLAMNVFRQRGKQRNRDKNPEEVRVTVLECRHKHGSVVAAELVAKSLYDREGNFSGILGVSRDITSRRNTERDLRKSEERFRSLIEQASDAIFVHDLEGRFIEVNQEACASLGHTRDELLSMSVWDIDPDIGQRGDNIRFWQKLPATFQARHIRKDGTTFPVEIRLGPIEFGETKLVLALVRDITDRINAEEQIKASLKEKEVLLREIHHRVKNNLAVIQSLLRLRSRYSKNQLFSQLVEDTENRIRSMALAHELLYQSENLAKINTRDYVNKLLEHLVDALSHVGQIIKVTSELQDTELGIDIGIPLGFVITELVSNCFKHAFPGNRPGEIIVRFQSTENKQFELSVKDDGVGIAANINVDHPDSMGLDLVRIFAKQLNGTMEIVRDNGTHVSVRFRVS